MGSARSSSAQVERRAEELHRRLEPVARAGSSGALGEVAATPFGAFALQARARQAGEAAKGVGEAVVFLALAGTALTSARGGSSSSEGSADDATATLVAPPGVALLVAVGAGFVLHGVWCSVCARWGEL